MGRAKRQAKDSSKTETVLDLLAQANRTDQLIKEIENAELTFWDPDGSFK